MGGVRVGVQEADRDRGDAFGARPLRRLPHRLLVQLGPLLAARAGPLGDLVAQPARDERRRLLVLELVHDRDPQPPQLEHVAEAGGRQQAAARSLPFEHGVRGDRGRVDDLGDARRRRPGLLQQLEDALDDAAGVVVGRRQHLLRPQRAVGAEQDDVGERPADVDADPVAVSHVASRSLRTADARSRACRRRRRRRPARPAASRSSDESSPSVEPEERRRGRERRAQDRVLGDHGVGCVPVAAVALRDARRASPAGRRARPSRLAGRRG